ncbi:MAG: transposase [Acidobacteria bacterium]|nr:transposase [Acidobacteriota bacterium]
MNPAKSATNTLAVTVPVHEDLRQKRRYRSKQERRRIVEESFAPGASVARVARAHEVNANLPELAAAVEKRFAKRPPARIYRSGGDLVEI